METRALQAADGRWIAHRLIIARSFVDRLRGVLKHGPLPPGTALLLSPCSSIHTFAVPFCIDAIFLSGQLRILRLAPDIPPWRIRWAPTGTRHVLELPGGALKGLQLEPGTFVCVRSRTDDAESVASPAPRSTCSTAHLQFSLRIPRAVLHGHSVPPPPCARLARLVASDDLASRP